MIEDVKRDVSPIRGVGSANTGWEKIWRLLEICAKIGNPWIYSTYNKTKKINQSEMPLHVDWFSGLSSPRSAWARWACALRALGLLLADDGGKTALQDGPPGGRPRQHCHLSICEYWLSWTNTETAAATPPMVLVMQNLLRASAQWLVLESAVFLLISSPM